MIEEFKEVGIWWLPKTPERTVSGTIHFSPSEGISLQLVGTLVPEQDQYGSSSHSVVYGMSENLSAHTLTDCSPWGDVRNHNHYGSSKTLHIVGYRAGKIFKGCHISDPARMLVTEVTFGLSSLETWLYDLDLFTTQESHDEENSEETLRYRKNKSRDVVVQDATLSFWTYVGKSSSRNKLGLQIRSGIDIKPDVPRTLEGLLRDFVEPLRIFIDIATGQPSLLKCLSIKYAEGKGYSESLSELFTHVIFRDLGNSRTVGDYKSDDVFLRNELIDSASAFISGGKIIKDFFELRESVKATLDLYLLSRHYVHSFPFLELSFVAVVNALEAYHNERRESSRYEDEPWQAARQALKGALPKEWRSEVLQAFDYIKVKKLRSALNELFEEADPVARQLGEERTSLINAIANTRNYFSHYAKALESGKLDANEVFYTMHGLLAVTEVLVLKDLGFTTDKAVEQVRSTQRSSILRPIKLPAVKSDDTEKDDNLTDLIEEHVASGSDMSAREESVSEENSPEVIGDGKDRARTS